MVAADGNLGQMMEPVDLKESYPNAHDHSAWALTGAKGRTGHTITSIFLEADEMEAYIHRLYRKYDVIERDEVRFEEYLTDDAEVVLVGYGIVSRVVRSAVESLREEGVKAGMVRPITLWPFPKAPLRRLADQAKFFLCAEMSMGQMIEDVQLAVEGKRPVYFFGRQGGNVPTPTEIIDAVKQRM
jgi:2-oxoglutarate ferredoxin oxidoreductase subunit alpha